MNFNKLRISLIIKLQVNWRIKNIKCFKIPNRSLIKQDNLVMLKLQLLVQPHWIVYQYNLFMIPQKLAVKQSTQRNMNYQSSNHQLLKVHLCKLNQTNKAYLYFLYPNHSIQPQFNTTNKNCQKLHLWTPRNFIFQNKTV